MAQSKTSYLTGSATNPASRRLSAVVLTAIRHPVYGLWLAALAYLILLTLAEILTTLSVPWLGLALHGLVFASLLLHASLWARNAVRRFLLSLALAPLIRLLSLSLPLPSFPFVYWYLVIGTPLFLAVFLAARVGRVNGEMMGLTGKGLPLQFLVALTGVGLGYIEYLILRPDPLVPELRLDQILVPALILLIFTGLLEEVIFRGLMQYTAVRAFGCLGLFYVAVIFAVLHIGYRSALDLLFVFSVAVYFAWITHRSGSILGAALAHGVTNIALYLFFPFILTAPVKVPIGMPPQSPGLLAPAPTQQGNRQWLLPSRTPRPSSSPILEWTATLGVTETPTRLTAPTSTPCAAPTGWVLHDVREGDTLDSLSWVYRVSEKELLLVNCLGSNVIAVGQRLYVPSLPVTPVLPTPIPRPPSTSKPLPPPNSPTPLPTLIIPPSKTPLPPTSTQPLPTLPPEITSTPLPPKAAPTDILLPPTVPIPSSATYLPPVATYQLPTIPPPPAGTSLPTTSTPLPFAGTPFPPTPPIIGIFTGSSNFY